MRASGQKRREAFIRAYICIPKSARSREKGRFALQSHKLKSARARTRERQSSYMRKDSLLPSPIKYVERERKDLEIFSHRRIHEHIITIFAARYALRTIRHAYILKGGRERERECGKKSRAALKHRISRARTFRALYGRGFTEIPRPRPKRSSVCVCIYIYV